jgi:transcriptional regulator with XRE-family HTH domain
MTGPQFKEARNAMGLSQRKLAEVLGVVKATIENIERKGCTKVMHRAMLQLASEYGVTIQPLEAAP